MTNLVTNGTFETNTTGWVASNSTLAQDSTQHHSGSASLKCTRTSSQFGAICATTGLTGGAWYRATCWILCSDIACTVRIFADMRDSGNGILWQLSGFNTIPVASTWTPIYMVFQAPANISSLNFTIFQSVSSTSDTLNIDDVDIELLSSDETAFFPNTSFGTDTAFWTTNQNWSQSNAGATVTRITSDSADGDSSCAQVVTDGVTALQGISTYLNGLANGTIFTFTAMVKRVSGSGTITLGARDQTNLVNVTTTTTSSSWTKLSLTITTGISNIGLILSVYSTGTSATTFLVDAITFGKKTTAATRCELV